MQQPEKANVLKFYIKKTPILYKFLRTIKTILSTFITIFIDFFIMLRFRTTSKHGGVLLVKAGGIGDFIIWLDIAKEFRNLYKRHRITVLCNSDCVEFARKLHFFDAIIPCNEDKFNTRFFYRFSILTDIRRNCYNTVIISSLGFRSFNRIDSIVRVSGARETILCDNDKENIDNLFLGKSILKWQRKISDRYYTNLIKIPDKQLIDLERNAEFIRSIKLTEFKCSVPKLPDDILPDNCLNDTIGRYYVLFPGASIPYKKWPVEKFSEIASRIYKDKGLIGVICGGPSEVNLAGKLLENAKDAQLINMAGKTSLLELASIIKDADIIVSSDTSAVHIAAAVSTPCVCVITGKCYKTVLPIPPYVQGNTKPRCVTYDMDCFKYCDYYDGSRIWKCIPKVKFGEPVWCIKNVSVDAVWNEVSLIFEQANMTQKNYGN